MLPDLLLALGIPLLLLLIVVQVLQRPDCRPPILMQRLVDSTPRLLPIGYGLILALSLLRWLLQR